MLLAEPAPMTVEQFFALPPDDAVERWLIDGELRERPAMPYRNRYHCRAMTRIAAELDNWSAAQPQLGGTVLTGDAGFRIPGEPTTLFGLDVAYVDAGTIAKTPANSTMVFGVPVLAVEIMSPSDTLEHIKEKLGKLLAAGTPLVWILDTYDRTVIAYRPNCEPRFFAASMELDAEPLLPGFRASVGKLFE